MALILVFVLACSESTLSEVKESHEGGTRELVVDPYTLDFGATAAAVTDVVTLRSVGDLAVTVESLQLFGSPAFSVVTLADAVTLEPDSELDVVVTYTPASVADSGTLRVNNDGATPLHDVELLGQGLYPNLALDPAALVFTSQYGEAVDATVTVTSTGTADLQLYTMLVEGEGFSAAGEVPVTLAPGESIAVEVTWDPAAENLTASGSLWFTTNTPTGYAMVPLAGSIAVPCLGLGEAWDRGLLEVRSTSTATNLLAENLSADDDLCMDQWYVVVSVQSQDAAIGDPFYDIGGDYPMGSLTVGPADYQVFIGADDDDPAWWCVEHEQMTAANAPYEFTGGRVPEPLLTYMLWGDQDAVWAWQEDHPVVIAGRQTNWVEVTETAPVELWLFNMGEGDATFSAFETIPAGFSATDFSREPDGTVANSDGSTTYRFDLELDGRVVSGSGGHTAYDEARVEYTLVRGSCLGRVYAPELRAEWVDASGSARTSTANPLVIDCL